MPIQIKKIWLLPPLAFGRIGSADRPCQAFSWASPVITPKGVAKTILTPEDTIEVSDDGTPTLREARAFNRIDLKDDAGRFFPVCPFFELHGAWSEDGADRQGPITEAVLQGAGLSRADVIWTVTVANLKAFHYTLNEGDKVEARREIVATDTGRHDLEGRSTVGPAGQRLVPGPGFLRFGAIQAIRPTSALPGLRMRVLAPGGLVYGPTDIAQRIVTHGQNRGEDDEDWSDLDIPQARRIINPNSAWARYRRTSAPPPLMRDPRVNPGGLAANFRAEPGADQSLGLLDDVSDGLVTCRVGTLAPAHARIAIGPPDFSPASRPFVSLQDGLSDRVARQEAEAIGFDELEEIVADIFERALETSDLLNKDAQTGRSHGENGTRLPQPSPDFELPPIRTLWPFPGTATGIAERVDALPVSFLGQRKHRRLNALEYLKDRLRDDPVFVERWLRPPLDDSEMFDRRMPPLMRGSDGRPMHLTRRQYDLVKRWARAIASGATD
jgi:hypothetical protein